MNGFLLVAALLTASPPPNVGDALDRFDEGSYRQAAMVLDDLAEADPDTYRTNNLHYLRGRIAEMEEDFPRAEQEFNQIGADSILYDPAVWHLARVALMDGRPAAARQALEWLPADFPEDLRIELARLAPPALALEIYDGLATREARLERARVRGDREALWALVRQSSGDDVAVRAARELYDPSLGAADRLFLANTYAAHRAFDLAEPLYASLLEDPDLGAEAHLRLGRVYFQRTDYDRALGMYRATMLRFPGTDWADEAELQIPGAYWRKPDLEAAAYAYLDIIHRYGNDRRRYQSAVRDLVDVYRTLGDNAAALDWIGRGLANGSSAVERAVLLFTRAKIAYLTGDYEGALASLRDAARLPLETVPNGTDIEEVRFFEALSLEKLERVDEARAIWGAIAQEAPFSYYGLRSADRLGEGAVSGDTPGARIERTRNLPTSRLCRRPGSVATREQIRSRRLEGARAAMAAGARMNRVEQLAFLNLWDEASYWALRQANRYDSETLADLAFLAGDYRHAILYADRLRAPSDDLFDLDQGNPEREILRAMQYPAGFSDLICGEAADAAVDPLWLRSIIWQESRFDPAARSGALARGLMQFIPETALDMATRLGMAGIDVTRALYTPEVSVRLGAHYWADLLDEFGQAELALAAYNGGPHNVRRWRAKSGSDEPEIFVSDIGFVETKSYVRRIFELYARYAYLQGE